MKKHLDRKLLVFLALTGALAAIWLWAAQSDHNHHHHQCSGCCHAPIKTYSKSRRPSSEFDRKIQALGQGTLPLPPKLARKKDVIHLRVPHKLLHNKWACVMHAEYSFIRAEEAFGVGIKGASNFGSFEKVCLANMSRPRKEGTSSEMWKVSNKLVKNAVAYLGDPRDEIALERSGSDLYESAGHNSCNIIISKPHPVKGVGAPKKVHFTVPYSFQYLKRHKGRLNRCFNKGYKQELEDFMKKLRTHLDKKSTKVVHVACLIPAHVFAVSIIKDGKGDKRMVILDNYDRAFKAGSPSEKIVSLVYDKLMA